MNEMSNYFALLDRVAKVADSLPRRAAREAVNFSNERFRAQNWVDTSTQPWKKRKPARGESRKRAGRAILVNTARLKRSTRVVYYDKTQAKVANDVEYAAAHNEGFNGNVNQNVRKHQRTSRKGRSHTVKAHSRTIRQRIPQRRFLGASAVLDARIQRMMIAELVKPMKG